MEDQPHRDQQESTQQPYDAGEGSRSKADESSAREGEQADNLITQPGLARLSGEEEQVFRRALVALKAAGIQFMVGGAFAKFFYTGMWRFTKDLDVFLKPESVKGALEALENAGFETEITDTSWLAKAFDGEYLVDLIFGSGHGQVPVDGRLFDGSIRQELFGIPVRLMPVEAIIALAAFVAARDRFDGSDIVHLIRAKKGEIDWQRILDRLGENEQLLLWHLILFDYVYPGHSEYLPKDLMQQLFSKMVQSWSSPVENEKRFRGTLLDQKSFAVDVDSWGYENLRTKNPLVNEVGEAL